MMHTKGSWQYDMLEGIAHIYPDDERFDPKIAEAYTEANARLIAAAPELLYVAECALADLETIDEPDWDAIGDTIDELREAIRKAKSRP